jgi:hypothetical protein
MLRNPYSFKKINRGSEMPDVKLLLPCKNCNYIKHKEIFELIREL